MIEPYFNQVESRRAPSPPPIPSSALRCLLLTGDPGRPLFSVRFLLSAFCFLFFPDVRSLGQSSVVRGPRSLVFGQWSRRPWSRGQCSKPACPSISTHLERSRPIPSDLRPPMNRWFRNPQSAESGRLSPSSSFILHPSSFAFRSSRSKLETRLNKLKQGRTRLKIHKTMNDWRDVFVNFVAFCYPRRSCTFDAQRSTPVGHSPTARDETDRALRIPKPAL